MTTSLQVIHFVHVCILLYFILNSFKIIIDHSSYFLPTFVGTKNNITKTMKKFICILLALLPFFAFAKDNHNKKEDKYNPKYLAGAVTLTDGKVIFDQNFQVPTLSKKDIYQKLEAWANERFKPEDKMNSRVAYTNEEDGQIAAIAEEYLVFSSSAISLDRTRIYYHLSMFVEEGSFKMEISRIRYWYDENRDGGEKYNAEEWIVDEMALNKKKTKLAPICGKFRRETIDLKDELFKEASMLFSIPAQTVNSQVVSVVTPVSANSAQPVAVAQNTQVQPVVAPVAVTNTQNAAPKKLVEIGLNELPANLSEMASAGRLTITAGEEEIEVKPEVWGGFGKLLNKDVAYTVIDKSRMAISLIMEHNDTYKISFYQTGNTEPYVVIDCKKSMKQELTADELKSLNKQVDANKQYAMYIGVITRCMKQK